jgi:serine/threonine protein kinase
LIHRKDRSDLTSSSSQVDRHQALARKVFDPIAGETHFQNELDFMKKLCNKGHDHIIKVFGIGTLPTKREPRVFIDLELCDTNLAMYKDECWKIADWIESQRPATVWDITDQIAHGLAFIHAEGAIHRDLKPENGNYLLV